MEWLHWERIQYRLKTWFQTRERDQKFFDPHRFLSNILYFLVSFIFSLIIYDNISFFNRYNLLFLRIGSVLLLIGVYFSFKYLYYVIKQIRNRHYNLSRGYKVVIALVTIVILLLIYLNPAPVITKIGSATSKVELSRFNPFSVAELAGDTNIVEPGALSSKMDLRKFTTFLPQPWGFLIFWGLMVGILLWILSKYLFGGELPQWIVVLLVIIGIAMAFQFKIPYNTVNIDSLAVCDASGNLQFENNFLGVGQLGAAFQCIEYKSSQCRPMCMESSPVCQCEANIVDIIFHQRGDWILG